MIPPLDIYRMMFHQLVHNQMRSRTSVVNITDNMKMIHNKPLNQFTKCYNKLLSSSDADNGTDNGRIIRFLICQSLLFCNQFFNYIREILRKRLSHFGAGILACRSLTDLDQTVERNLIPVIHIRFCLTDLFHLLPWIVDQCCQCLLISRTHRVCKHIIDLPLYRTRSVFEDMIERLIFTMHIRYKMLRPLWKIQNRLKIDDFG